VAFFIGVKMEKTDEEVLEGLQPDISITDQGPEGELEKARGWREKAMSKVVYIPPPEDGAPPVLQDLRHVYINHACYDKTLGQKAARKFRKTDYKAFLTQLSALEKEHRNWLAMEAERERAKGVMEEMDLGTQRCLELAKKVLDEMGDFA